MNTMRASVIVLALLSASAAQAAVSVVGGGTSAHICYRHAEKAFEPRQSVAICTDALKSDVLSSVDRASTLVNRAILKSLSDDTDGAMADYAAALALGANDDEVYLNRSATLIALKRYDEALKDADQAVRLNTPRIEIAYYNRALAHEALGHVQEAYADYQAAVRAQPRFAAASESLSRFRVVKSGG